MLDSGRQELLYKKRVEVHFAVYINKKRVVYVFLSTIYTDLAHQTLAICLPQSMYRVVEFVLFALTID